MIKQYPQFWSTSIHNFDQHLYTIWPNFDTGGVEVWSNFGRHFDQTSALGVSKFGRSLASKFGRHLIEHLDFTMWFIHISSKLRPNFDIGGVGVWSKFGRRFYPNSTKLRHWCQSLGEVSTKFRNQKISTILINIQLQLWPNRYRNFDQHISTILIQQYT